MFFIDILVTLIEVHYSRGASYRPASSSGLTRGSRRWLLGRRHLHSYLGFLRPALAYQRLDLRGSHGDRGPLGLHPTLLFHHWLPAMLEQQDGMDLMGRKESFLRSVCVLHGWIIPFVLFQFVLSAHQGKKQVCIFLHFVHCSCCTLQASEVSHVESVVSDNDEKRWLGYQFQVPVVETVTPHLAEEAAGGGI